MVLASGVRHGRTVLVIGLDLDAVHALVSGNPLRLCPETHRMCPADLEIEIVPGLTDRQLADRLIAPGAVGSETTIVMVARESDPVPHRMSAQPCGCDPGAKWVCERHQERCGATCDGLVCDREQGHVGNHRDYNAQIDEPMFWAREPEGRT